MADAHSRFLQIVPHTRWTYVPLLPNLAALN